MKDTHAIFTCDPGGTSGIAAGYITPSSTLKQTLLTATRLRSIEVTGDYMEQGQAIAECMIRFDRAARDRGCVNIHFAFEDFILRRRQAGGATGNLTSCWVAAAATALAGFDVHWQQPSEAKSFASNDRLKLWGLYTVGSEHERDAWRHFAVRANRVVP